MNEKIDETVLSQLVDGELDSDRQNEVLSDVLADADARERLAEHLRLRGLLGHWRRQEPTGVVRVPPLHRNRTPAGSRSGHLLSLAAALFIGGVLVASGFLLARHDGVSGDISLTSDERMRIARVFQLHESVAGPLGWYVADEEHVMLGSPVKLTGDPVSRPVAVVLRLSPASNDRPTRTYVIICRDNHSANIDLPGLEGTGLMARFYLMPEVQDGGIEVQYALAESGVRRDLAVPAALAGRRAVGSKPTRLGQLALGDELMNVDAVAWVIREKATP